MKIAALDVGDQWTGIALSDASGILAKPYTTVETENLLPALSKLLEQEKTTTIVIGYPKTLKGTKSQQTQKIDVMAELLRSTFPTITWILWDERLSSKRAEMQKKNFSKEEKLRSHAVAAAFILDSYLSYLHMQKNLS